MNYPSKNVWFFFALIILLIVIIIQINNGHTSNNFIRLENKAHLAES